MKRDMDLVRKILFAVEEREMGEIGKIDIPDYSQELIGRHVELMLERGLIDGKVIPNSDGPHHRIAAYIVNRLTWNGYDFLDASRNETIWERAKKKCMEETGGLALDLLRETLSIVGKEMLRI